MPLARKPRVASTVTVALRGSRLLRSDCGTCGSRATAVWHAQTYQVLQHLFPSVCPRTRGTKLCQLRVPPKISPQIERTFILTAAEGRQFNADSGQSSRLGNRGSALECAAFLSCTESPRFPFLIYSSQVFTHLASQWRSCFAENTHFEF
jgi:hypothetical protein